MTINVKHITALGGGETFQIDAELQNGVNSESRSLRILSSQYAKLRPAKGEISRFQFEELENAAEVCRAYLRALNILSFGTNTAQALHLKLRRRGFSQQVAEETVAMLRDRGYISEESDMQRIIEHCISKMWGSRRIISYLYQKGYDDETISLAEDALADIDFDSLCLELLSSRTDELPQDPQKKQKLISYLSRYGYSMSEIRYAFANFARGSRNE